MPKAIETHFILFSYPLLVFPYVPLNQKSDGWVSIFYSPCPLSSYENREVLIE